MPLVWTPCRTLSHVQSLPYLLWPKQLWHPSRHPPAMSFQSPGIGAWLAGVEGASDPSQPSISSGPFKGMKLCKDFPMTGIIHQTTSPYTPEQNGVTKRYNRTLQEGALTLQHDADLSNKFWVSAIDTMSFVWNRVLHSKIGTTPYEAFWGIKPRIDWLRTYGSKCWALIPKQVCRKGKYKSIEGIFIGYFKNSRSYKIWIPKTHSLIKTRDAIFDESNHIE